jgi:hypothetical protein
MGLSTSQARPRGNTQVTHSIYPSNRYFWNAGQIAKNIQNGVVTPTYPPEARRTRTADCSCLICYQYFPRINQTNCCQHAACTECLACIAKPPPEARLCPFCRAANFTIQPNLQRRQLAHPSSPVDGIDDQPIMGLEKSDSDELIALFMQYPDIDKEAARQLYQADVPVGEIIESLMGGRE